MSAALFAPVELPVRHVGIAVCGANSGGIDLLEVLPARDAKATGDDGKIVLVRVERGALEAHVEACGAARAALGFPFESLHALEPVLRVVVRIHEGDAVLLREPDVLLL